jgi:hypothetical protein
MVITEIKIKKCIGDEKTNFRGISLLFGETTITWNSSRVEETAEKTWGSLEK